MKNYLYKIKVTYADGFVYNDEIDLEGWWLQFHDDYDNIDDILYHIRYLWSDGGNYSCDCNRSLFRFGNEGERPCGHTIKLAKVEAITPDGKVYLVDENC